MIRHIIKTFLLKNLKIFELRVIGRMASSINDVIALKNWMNIRFYVKGHS